MESIQKFEIENRIFVSECPDNSAIPPKNFGWQNFLKNVMEKLFVRFTDAFSIEWTEHQTTYKIGS